MARDSILVIEHKLGLSPSDLMSQSELSKHPMWQDLLKGIKPILLGYAGKTRSQLRITTSFASDIEVLADYHGPRIWSDDPEQRDQLLTRAARNNHNGHYPKDLYWSVPQHQEIILAHLTELVIEKVVNYGGHLKKSSKGETQKSNESPIGDPSQERGFDQLFNEDEAQEAGISKNEDRPDTPSQS